MPSEGRIPRSDLSRERIYSADGCEMNTGGTAAAGIGQNGGCMTNIILIGMPGCGKSTVGIVLAKAIGYRFIDSDLLIQSRENRLLSEIIAEEGTEGFNRIEESVNASIRTSRSVIATGGSVVYGPKAMEHLRQIGLVIYLKLPLEEVEERLGDLTERGVSLREGQTLEDLYRERTPLYEEYAHLVVEESGMSIRDVVSALREATREFRQR